MATSEFRNKYPIILVHGFIGWGRDEMFGFKYWGGTVDIEARLNDKHFHTRTATVGPISSSWERTVELYHYLVGGRVDYGAAHAKKYGVKRYGHTFAGIYPQISDTCKVHLVGHSMGGQTACELDSMLRKGSQEERDYHAAHPDEDPISDLFLGGKHWVHSVTGLAAGFSGTSFLDGIGGPVDMKNLMRVMLVSLASVNGANPNEFVYDFKLDQWGLKREKGEMFVAYMERVLESDLWKSANFSVHDLSLPGAERIARERLDLSPQTYYFSFSGKATFTEPHAHHALPMPTINPAFYLGALLMGRTPENPDLDGRIEDWRNSDGGIPCAAAHHVVGQAFREADPNDMSFPSGTWNAFPPLNGWDHMDFTGTNPPYIAQIKDIMPFFTDLARLLTGTEPANDPVPAQVVAAGGAAHTASAHRHAATAHATKAAPKKKK